MLFWTSQLRVGGETLKQNNLLQGHTNSQIHNFTQRKFTNSHKEKIMQNYKERHSQLVISKFT